jgi:hypothetical protein
LQLGRVLARWARYDLIALDEVGYVRGLVGAARELKMKSEFHAASPVRLVLVDFRPA